MTGKTQALESQEIIAITDCWINRFVVELNLCPFARRELEAGRVRYSVSLATSADELITMLADELQLLDNSTHIETTFVVHPGAFLDFSDYNLFLDEVDELLRQMDYEGQFQVASFHPDYQFAGTEPADAENYSNRSPYPMLHLLREDSVSRAVANHPAVKDIPNANIERLNAMGSLQLEELRVQCFEVEANRH